MRFLFGGYCLIFLTRSRTSASQLNLNKDIRIFSYEAGERTPLRILAGGFPPAKILKEPAVCGGGESPGSVTDFSVFGRNIVFLAVDGTDLHRQ